MLNLKVMRANCLRGGVLGGTREIREGQPFPRRLTPPWTHQKTSHPSRFLLF